MSSKDSRILCVDIGSDSVKAAEFSQPRKGAILLEKFAYMENGLGDISSDDPEFRPTVEETIRNLILANGFLAKNVYLSISGQNAFIRFVKVPAMTEDPEKIQRLLEFEAKQNIPFDEQEIAYDSQIIMTDVENAQVEAMFAIVKSSDVEANMRCMEKLRKKVKNVEIAATASYNACNFNGVGAEHCEMVLNIGGRSSTLIFIDQGKFFVRTFLTAGHAITQQISKEFNISYAEAEELKIRHGFVGLGGAYEEPESVVASTVSKIIRNVMTRLHGEIIRTVNVYRAGGGRKPEKMYLTGGSSVMTYTPHFFSEKLRIPVEYLNPFQVVALSPKINKEELASVAHLFSEVVGLSMRNAVVCPVEISLIPPERKAHDEMAKRIPFFYGTCLALMFCVFVIYWSFWNQESTVLLQKDEFNNESQIVRKKTEEVQKVFSELNSQKADFESVYELCKDRARWYTIFGKLDKGLPEGVWFTSVKGIESKDSSGKSTQTAQTGSLPTQSNPAVATAAAGQINYIEFKGCIIVRKPQDKVTEEQGIAETAQNTKDVKNAKNAKAAPIVIEAKSAEEIYEELLKYIANTGLFEEFSEIDRMDLEKKFNLPPSDSGQNISTFTIEAKLKVPYKK